MAKRRITRKRATKRRATPVRKTKRRRSTRRRSMLSELFTPATAQGGMRTVLSGAAGSIAGQVINKMTPNQSVNTRAGIKLLGGFLAATVGKMPNVGAGLSAVGVYELIQNSGFLAENMQNSNFASSLDALPPFLNENGNPMYLSEGEPMYLADNGAPMYLADDDDLGYDVGYYGAGFGFEA